MSQKHEYSKAGKIIVMLEKIMSENPYYDYCNQVKEFTLAMAQKIKDETTLINQHTKFNTKERKQYYSEF